MMRKLILMLAFSTVFAAFPLSAGEASARREAARLAAKRAEEATNKSRTGGARTLVIGGEGPEQPSAEPVEVDGEHVEIVSEKDVPLHGAGDLADKRYILVEIDGEKVEEGTDAFVEWHGMTGMSGKMCNLFRTKCTFENTVVKTEEIPATRMACADEVMGKVEARLFSALRLGMSFVAVGDFLEMRRDDLVLRFTLDKPEENAKPEEEAAPEEKAAPEGENGGEAGEAEKAEPVVVSPPVSEPVDAPAAGSAAEDGAKDAPVDVTLAPVAGEAGLIGRRFTLTKVDGEEFVIAMGAQPFIEFGEGMRVGGSACNVFTGLGELSNGRLVVANAVATKKMCIDAKLSGFEAKFHRMLREGVAVEAEGEVLTLTGGGTTLEFVEAK